MPSAFELLSAIARIRADAISIVVLAIAGCAICRSLVRRRGALAGEFSGMTCMMVIGVTIAGVLLVEWTRPFLTHPASATRSIALMSRALVLGSAALVAAVWLTAAVRIALLRTDLRTHADSGRQLQLAMAAADEARRAKNDFLAVMSHEIRTPLNAVLGFTSLLSETKLDDAQRVYANMIASEGTRLGCLINDVLDITKLEKGSLVLEKLPFAPAETATEVMRMLSSRAAEKKIHLRFEAHLAGPLLVAGDPLRFRQILVNLLDNAIKFTPRGTVTLHMAWDPPVANSTLGQLAIRVCDTGIGIPADKLRDLFQMFMQADTSTARRYGGTGLGLAICQRLVTLMGGEIIARSTLGEGSEFAFTLPVPPFFLPVDAAPSIVEPDVKPATPLRILVVDDMENNRFLLEIFLRRHGFDPQLAAGGEEAVSLALANRYDAILMDLQMPGTDGYAATQRIRSAEPPGRHTPIIALTASLAKGTRERCLDAGMDEHLTKPLDLGKFKSLLNGLTRPGDGATPIAS